MRVLEVSTLTGVKHVDQTDFVDAERMRELFRTFEEKSRLLKI